MYQVLDMKATQNLFHGIVFTAIYLFCSQSMAVNISQTPLYAGGGVKPNVLFMIDDSGSMRDAVNPSRAAAATPELAGMAHSQFLIDPKSTPDKFDDLLSNLNDADQGFSYLALCPAVNVLAFDPKKTYDAWHGLPNSSYPNAIKIPNQNMGTTNLANARYLPWTDSNNNGVYDFGECGELGVKTIQVQETQWGWYGPYTVWVDKEVVEFDLTKLQRVSTLSTKQKQNFANWYTYHRSREFAVKAGMSEVIANLRVRAGMSTIHIHNEAGIEWGLNITDVDDFSDPTKAANKQKLLDELYEIIEVNPANFGGTPLRSTLENAGLYFHLDNPSTPEGKKPEANFLPDLSTSPLLSEAEGGACQSNHMILVTDGYQFEFNNATQHQSPRINWGNVDKTSASGGGIYGDEVANTLADIAMYFYDADASPTLAGKQNVHTHALSFGVYGNIDGFPQTEAEAQWPTDFDRMIGTSAGQEVFPDSLDDVVHAAFNGRGSFMTATDAESLRSEMEALMNYISSTSKGTATAISFDNQSMAASTTMYRTLYQMEDWSGKLNAYNFDAATNTVGSEKWEASARLDLINENNPRKVVTFNGAKGVVFKSPVAIAAPNINNGEMSAEQIADLLADRPITAAEDEYLQDIIEYIRMDGDGYTTNPQFRIRSSLGDIVHSSPVYVGAPDGFYPDDFESKKYSEFATAKKSRKHIVYVGANDGMLHAFDANTGDEVFAYIPKGVFSSQNRAGLHWLADPYYYHIPYVDETATAADVFVNNAWRTYLLGGLGRGGKSVYVLDVTNPASKTTEQAVADDVVVTEFTDSYLGYTYGAPKVAKLEDGEWVAIFGNGYNNDTDGKAYLYILYLDGSGPGGVNHLKVGPLGGSGVGSVVNNSCLDPSSDCNGLSAPTLVDLDANGKLDRVYAGDLHGNVWAFDFTKDSSGNKVTAALGNNVKPSVAHQDSYNNGIPLFTACRGTKPMSGYCSPSDRQPITTKPSIAAHPSKGEWADEPNLLVFVGTGQYLAESDVTSTDKQSFYGIWDSGASDGGIRPTQLTTQTLRTKSNGTRTVSSSAEVTYLKKSQDPSSVGNYGWKINLPSSGERVIENPVVINEVVLFATRITSNDLCARGGTGFLIGVDISHGKKPDYQVFPEQDGDVGIPELTGGEPVKARGAKPEIFIPDPDDDATPSSYLIVTEPKRAPKRASWTTLK